jgi:hypothetical protein
MQGLGIFVQSSILTLLLAATREANTADTAIYDDDDDDAVVVDDAAVVGDEDVVPDGDDYHYERGALVGAWRATYAVGAAVLLYVLVSRVMHLRESEAWIEDRRRRGEGAKARAGLRGAGCEGRGSGAGGDVDRGVGGGGGAVGFVPPSRREEGGRIEDPIISPTMSSLTMRSEFEQLGSTNLNTCPIIPAAPFHDYEEDEEEEEGCNDDVQQSGYGRGGWTTRRVLHSLGISSETMLLLRHYGVRLFGTSVTWLLWDVAFYGNKLFQSQFLIALTGEDASLVTIACGEFLLAGGIVVFVICSSLIARGTIRPAKKDVL